MKLNEAMIKLVRFGIIDVEDQNLDINEWNMRISNEFRMVFNKHLKENDEFGLSFVKTMEDMIKEKIDFNTFSTYCHLVYQSILLELELLKQEQERMECQKS